MRLNAAKATLLTRLGDPRHFEERERKQSRVRDQDAAVITKTLAQMQAQVAARQQTHAQGQSQLPLVDQTKAGSQGLSQVSSKSGSRGTSTVETGPPVKSKSGSKK